MPLDQTDSRSMLLSGGEKMKRSELTRCTVSAPSLWVRECVEECLGISLRWLQGSRLLDRKAGLVGQVCEQRVDVNCAPVELV